MGEPTHSPECLRPLGPGQATGGEWLAWTLGCLLLLFLQFLSINLEVSPWKNTNCTSSCVELSSLEYLSVSTSDCFYINSVL